MVLVDGRARPQCAVFALRLLRDDKSVVIIHDWHRQAYHVVLQVCDVVEEIKGSEAAGGGIVVLRWKRGHPSMATFPSWWHAYP